MLHEIWMAEDKELDVTDMNAFADRYDLKYHKAVECLLKNLVDY